MNQTEVGLLLLVLAGLMNASFTLPMKFMRRWAWENTWLAWTIFTLLVLPIAVAFSTVPGLTGLYRGAGIESMLPMVAFGIGWGLSQVFFGIAVEAIGVALTFSLVLGTSAAMGAVIPMLCLHPAKLHTAAGHTLLLGTAVVLLGVAACALAGRMRDRAVCAAVPAHRSHSTTGLVLAILCGCGASFVNFGLAFGTPLIDAARGFGANQPNAANVVWPPVLAAGAVPNVLYCLYLLRKNSSGRNFLRSRGGYWVLALVMAICWFGSVLLYGRSVSQMGPLGTAVGWPLFMSLIVVAASLLGIATGEWKRSGRWPLAIQMAGVVVLIVAIDILAKANQALA